MNLSDPGSLDETVDWLFVVLHHVRTMLLSDSHVPFLQIGFTLTDASGSAVTEWDSGQEYDLTITSYDQTAAYAWAHSSVGYITDVSTSGTQAACSNAFYSSSPATSHIFKWTAPAAGDDTCVTITAAMAHGSTIAYQTNTARSFQL